MQFLLNDGGRGAAGFKGSAGDCVVRAVAIASSRPYHEIYDALSEGTRAQRKTTKSRKRVSARDGVNTKRKWFKDYMVSLGFKWYPTMRIGHDHITHMRTDELPLGRLVVAISKHYVAVINGVINDTHNPSRDGTRCVYGYYKLET
jgi:hypothetical protein